MSRVPFSADAVLALSPDDSSSKAARGLVASGKWPMLGASDNAVWGECQGSGSKPYQTQVDLSGAGPTFRCSCPSRKFPCKHGLALLLLQAQTPATFTAPEPAWVGEWLASRKERAEKKEVRASAAPAPADPAAAAKREDKRFERMAAGARELALWLDDLGRKGLAALAGQPGNATGIAARMVDAQAPGLAQRLTQAMALVGEGTDWPARLLARLGNLQLLVDAAQQRERLTPALQADLRQALGWPLEREEVLAAGPAVSDSWQVIAQVMVEREARLTERRVWLIGRQSARRALLVDFSYAGKAFEHGWMVGQKSLCALAFYPGADPLRAMLAQTVDDMPDGGDTAFSPVPGWDDEWSALAERMAANPWAERWPLLLGNAQLLRHADGWALLCGERQLGLRLSDADGWELLAFAGGQAVELFGEWEGAALRPLSAWVRGGSDCWRCAAETTS
ncbi:SWIM zinc finger family protein [Polaromonas sp.]|uniref:SWIM zinc finger family protein n=1 Tax=Polaromonas sp. TaxID=1869339 RepID=UPI0032675CAA